MPEFICNTSPLQYLHQLGRLDLLPNLVSRVVVPTAVAAELAEGRRLGLDLPVPENLPWADLREAPVAPLLSLVAALGPGETAVLGAPTRPQGYPPMRLSPEDIAAIRGLVQALWDLSRSAYL